MMIRSRMLRGGREAGWSAGVTRAAACYAWCGDASAAGCAAALAGGSMNSAPHLDFTAAGDDEARTRHP
jgi:hypothetical protein